MVPYISTKHMNDKMSLDSNNYNKDNRNTCFQNDCYDKDAGNHINLSDIKVTVGIDEDLRMILEMDPSIVDLGADIIGCTPTSLAPSQSNESSAGGYVNYY